MSHQIQQIQKWHFYCASSYIFKVQLLYFFLFICLTSVSFPCINKFGALYFYSHLFNIFFPSSLSCCSHPSFGNFEFNGWNSVRAWGEVPESRRGGGTGCVSGDKTQNRVINTFIITTTTYYTYFNLHSFHQRTCIMPADSTMYEKFCLYCGKYSKYILSYFNMAHDLSACNMYGRPNTRNKKSIC